MLKNFNGSSLAQNFSLATISLESFKEITRERRVGSKSALSKLVGLFKSKMSKRVWRKDVGGICTLTLKNKSLAKGYLESPGTCADTPNLESRTFWAVTRSL